MYSIIMPVIDMRWLFFIPSCWQCQQNSMFYVQHHHTGNRHALVIFYTILLAVPTKKYVLCTTPSYRQSISDGYFLYHPVGSANKKVCFMYSTIIPAIGIIWLFFIPSCWQCQQNSMFYVQQHHAGNRHPLVVFYTNLLAAPTNHLDILFFRPLISHSCF
ncbi:TPA: hypothetical protein LVM22_001136 [Klebsiella oxytoca]|nr:hypothetical protein [Klebsiella oxytoca]